jgi:hypothetical protein
MIASTILDFGSSGMIQFGMKRWRSLILVLIVVALVGFGARHFLEKEQNKNAKSPTSRYCGLIQTGSGPA